MALLFNFAPQFPPISTVTENITATPGGGLPGAIQLTSRYNRVLVVATAADSVKLPTYLVDQLIFVSNDAAAALAVFPFQVTDQIAPSAVGAAFSVPAGKTAMFVGTGTTAKWLVTLSA